MNEAQVYEGLSLIFSNVFDDPGIVLTSETSSSDVSGWDSLAHIRLIVAIEKWANLRFSSGEIEDLKNVGEFVELIVNKLRDNGK